MESNKKKVITISYRKSFGGYQAMFNIGVQTFSLCDKGTLEEVRFYCNMLKIAFEGLAKPDFGSGVNMETEHMKKACKDLANPLIEVIDVGKVSFVGEKKIKTKTKKVK